MENIKKKIEEIKKISKKGNTAEALAKCEEIIKKNDVSSKISKEIEELYSLKAVLKIDLEDYSGAILDCTKALELNFEKKDFYYIRAVAETKFKNYEKAIKDYTEVIKLSPGIEEAYAGRGMSNAILGKYQEAINDYTKVIEINEKSYKSYYFRGFLYGKLNDSRRAIEDYTKALNIKGDYIEALTNRGIEYHKLKDYINAVKDYQKAKKIGISSKKEKLKEMDLTFKEEKISNKDIEQAKLELDRTGEGGYLTFADILGWKGIWQRKVDKEMELVKKLLRIKEKLSSNDIRVDLISDTFVISCSSISRQIEANKKLIEECLVEKLLIRGATSFGPYYTKDSVYIGQAVDEAASWHEKGEIVGIFLTHSAKIQVKLSGNEKGLKEMDVEIKGGKIKTYFVEWYSKKNKENFYNVMNEEIIFPELYKKYNNTENYLENSEK